MPLLHDELRGMKASALRGRAAAEGIDDGRIEAARDQENAKAGLVALIMEHHTHLDVGQLRSMKKSALLERAKADGVDGTAIDDARDVDEDNGNNEAVIALIIAQAAVLKEKEDEEREAREAERAVNANAGVATKLYGQSAGNTGRKKAGLTAKAAAVGKQTPVQVSP